MKAQLLHALRRLDQAEKPSIAIHVKAHGTTPVQVLQRPKAYANISGLHVATIILCCCCKRLQEVHADFLCVLGVTLLMSCGAETTGSSCAGLHRSLCEHIPKCEGGVLLHSSSQVMQHASTCCLWFLRSCSTAMSALLYNFTVCSLHRVVHASLLEGMRP